MKALDNISGKQSFTGICAKEDHLRIRDAMQVNPLDSETK